MNLYLDLPFSRNTPVYPSRRSRPNTAILQNLSTSSSTFVTSTNSSVTISQSFFNKVPNVIRYTYKYLGNNQFQLLSPRCSCPLISTSNYPDIDFANSCPHFTKSRLVGIILESPHKDEYSLPSNNTMIPIAPAQGTTGRTIKNEIVDVLTNISNSNSLTSKFKVNEIVSVVIINPVPYQTSLIHIHDKALKGSYKTLRDNVWKCIWNTPTVQGDFQAVLNKFSSKDILINCCTYDLKKVLTPWLLSQLHSNSSHLMNGIHPSARKSWKNNIT